MKAMLGYAYGKKLPIRVIVIDGQPRTATKRAKIIGRLLDPKSWTVIKFKQKTGEIVLRRGDWASDYADQFSNDEPPEGVRSKSTGTSERYKRSGDIREWVLNRAKGKCEYCGQLGFELEDGRRYLETHHIIPLSKRGKDSTKNVIALCANDHRRSHVGVDKDRLAKAFAAKVRQRERNPLES
jgi:5-methylcytosine-specific restriction protein A